MLRLLVFVVSSVLVLLFLITAFRRLRYPYELEELEGYVFLSALRVFRGQALYPPPSLDFIPYMHAPLYCWAVATLGKVTGMTIATARLLSIASTLGSFAMLYALVFRESRRSLAAMTAVGLYAGCYPLVNCWFDLGRLDSLFLLLILVALYVTRFGHPVLAGLFWILCFGTKQSILPVAFVMLCSCWNDVRRTFAGLLTFTLGSVATVAWADHVSRGWYHFYVFSTPAANADVKDVLRPFGLAVGTVVAALVFTRPNLRGPIARFYLCACSLVPVFWVVRSHAGSAENANMPVYALFAILFGLGVARLEDWMSTLSPALAPKALLLLFLCVLAQLGAGIYNPNDYVPAANRRLALDAIIAQLRSVPGDIYVARHAYYAWLAGKPVHADLVSVRDAERVNGTVRSDLRDQLGRALEGHRFSAIALDDQEDLAAMDSLAEPGSGWRKEYTTPAVMSAIKLTTSPQLLMFHR